MITKDTKNPFRAGTGDVPPCFPGRENELYHLENIIKELSDSDSPSKDTIFVAPRGNGKTALITWFMEKIKKEEKENIDVIKTTPNEIKTTGYLVNKIALPGWVQRLQKNTGLQFKYSYAGLQVESGNKASQDDIDPGLICDELQRRCERKATVLIIDEAHSLEPEIGNHILNASQGIRNSGAPFDLILAGTPGLLKNLSDMNATFWERFEVLKPGLLSIDDAHKALVEPLYKLGVTGGKRKLKEWSRETQGYPYFTQVYGEKLFQQLQKKESGKISSTIAKATEAEVKKVQEHFYQTRYDMLKVLDLASIAQAVAKLYGTQRSMHENRVNELLQTIELPENLIPSAAEQLLINEGYIWRGDPLDQSIFHAGIPSLMEFAKKKSDKPPGERGNEN